jgi:hypothetical protein
MKKLKSHFEVSEWPLVILTLLIVVLINQLVIV